MLRARYDTRREIGRWFLALVGTLCASMVAAQSVALAQTRCSPPVTPDVEIAVVPCPYITGGGSACLGWNFAEGVFTASSFRAAEDGLWLDGTFSGTAHGFSGVQYTLTDQFSSLPVATISLTPVRIELTTEITSYGPYVPGDEVDYATSMSIPYADEHGPGLSYVNIEPVTWTAYPSRASARWAMSAWKRAGDDPALQADVLNSLLFPNRE